MKIKIGDLTLRQHAELCKKYDTCASCPLYQYNNNLGACRPFGWTNLGEEIEIDYLVSEKDDEIQITKPGDLSKKYPYKCDFCGCEFKLTLKYFISHKDSSPQSLTQVCPCCGQRAWPKICKVIAVSFETQKRRKNHEKSSYYHSGHHYHCVSRSHHHHKLFFLPQSDHHQA